MICNKRGKKKNQIPVKYPSECMNTSYRSKRNKKTMCLSRGRKFCFFKGHSYDLSLLDIQYLWKFNKQILLLSRHIQPKIEKYQLSCGPHTLSIDVSYVLTKYQTSRVHRCIWIQQLGDISLNKKCNQRLKRINILIHAYLLRREAIAQLCHDKYKALCLKHIVPCKTTP